MSKALFRLQLWMFILVTSVTLPSCVESDLAPRPEEVYKTSRSIDPDFFSGYDKEDRFTPDQISILSRLEAINDSIAASSIEFDAPQSNDQQQYVDWNEVTTADVAGLYEGVKFGCKYSHGLWSKIKNAALFGAVFSVVYSLVALVLQLFSVMVDVAALSNPSPTCPYTFPQIYSMVAYVYNETDLDDVATRYIRCENSFVMDNTDDEFKIALMHNEVVRRLRSGQISPAVVPNNPFSQKELDFMNSTIVADYFDDVPNIVDGSVSFVDKYGDLSDRFANRIVDLYTTGISGLSSSNSTQFVTNVQTLCRQYIGVLRGDQSLDSDMKSILISSFYVGPLSAEYWTQEYR